MCQDFGSNGATSKDQVTSLKAGDYIDKCLKTKIMENNPNVQITLNQVRMFKEQFAFVNTNSNTCMINIRERGKPISIDISEEIQFECEQMIPEILEHIELFVSKFDPERQEIALKNIYLAGGGSQIKGLDKMIEQKLQNYGEVKVTCVQNPDFIGCEGALKITKEIPLKDWEQIGPVCHR